MPALGVVLAVAGAIVLSFLLWNNNRVLTYPDTMHYYQQSLRFTGDSEKTPEKAMDFVCGDFRRWDEISTAEKADCREYVGERWSFPDPYQDIFKARPLYPLLAAPFLKVFGPPGFVLCSFLISAACGVAMYAAARSIGMSRMNSLIAEFLFYVLPTGFWATRMLSEGTALLGILVALAGVGLTLRGNRRRGLLLVFGGLLWALLARSSSGQAAALGIACGAAALALTSRGDARRSALWAAATAVALGIGHFLVSAALGLPGVKESLHDFYGAHFQKPMPSDAYARLWDDNVEFWGDWLETLPNWNMGSGLALLGLVGLALALGRASVVWLAVGLSAALPLALHPTMGDVPRVGVHFWVTVALGLAVIIHRPRTHLPVATDIRPGTPATATSPAPQSTI